MYAGAMTEGIAWDISKWPFTNAHPFMPPLAREAGNAGHGTAKRASPLEVMLKIAAAAKKKHSNAPRFKIQWESAQR